MDRTEQDEELLDEIAHDWSSRILADPRIDGYVSVNLRHRPPGESLADHSFEWMHDCCHVSNKDADKHTSS